MQHCQALGRLGTVLAPFAIVWHSVRSKPTNPSIEPVLAQPEAHQASALWSSVQLTQIWFRLEVTFAAVVHPDRGCCWGWVS